MPGLIGFTDKRRRYNKNMLLNMRNLLKHFDNYVDEELYFDNDIYASRTHLGIINQGKQPYIYNNQFFSWMEGEFYNQEELKSKYNVVSVTDNELLVNIYNSTKSFEFLKDVDGYYAAVLYDKEENKVYLITDRFGFKPLYWSIINDNLVWSSETKGFLGHKDFKPVIDHWAVAEFFGIGYLLENRTWFENIELVPPASVFTYDLKKSKIEIEHYWSWSNIRPIKGYIDEKDLAEEVGRLFKQAVRRRVNDNEKIGISLSGGRDSRALLAAVPETQCFLHTFTFGREGCDDIKIARKVASIKNSKHHIVVLNEKNWFERRPRGVWITDGNMNLLHMHASNTSLCMRNYFDINLNGFAGDLVLGGSYLSANNLDKRINSKTVIDLTQCKMEIKKFNNWYMIDKTDPYFLNNRVRRFTNSGTILVAQTIEQRKPFFDNDLIELVYGIPDSLRYKGYIYKKMLLKTFPEYFDSIPWQKTGCPISYPERLVELIKFKNRVVNELKRESQRFGFNFKDLRGYTDYPAWIRQEPAKSFFEKVLLSKDALYPKYINKDRIQCYVRGHMERKGNYHDELCLALTFEIWLKQVYEGKYRDGPVLFNT